MHGNGKGTQTSRKSTVYTPFMSTPPTVISPRPAPIFDVTKFHREMKHIKLESKDFDAVCLFYDNIQTALVAATNNPEVIPDLEYLTP